MWRIEKIGIPYKLLFLSLNAIVIVSLWWTIISIRSLLLEKHIYAYASLQEAVGMHRVRTSPSREYSFVVACAYIYVALIGLTILYPRMQPDDALKFCKSMHHNLGCVHGSRNIWYICNLYVLFPAAPSCFPSPSRLLTGKAHCPKWQYLIVVQFFSVTDKWRFRNWHNLQNITFISIF